MAIDCSKISMGVVVADCGADATPGTAGRVILTSFSDIDKAGSTVVANVITEILLKAGKLGYAVDSLPDAIDGEPTLSTGPYKNSFAHSVVVRVFVKNENVKAFVNQFASAKVVAFVENNERGENGDIKWEAHGWDSGLKASDISAGTAMADGVVYGLTLTTPETGREGSLPKSVFKTSEEITDGMMESLITPAA